MTTLEDYITARQQGLALVEQCAGQSESALTAIGMDPIDAADMARLAHTYFGATAYAARQRRSVTGATERQHSLATIHRIEKHVAKISRHNQAWKLRELLCNTASVDIDRTARAFVKELKNNKEIQESLRITRRRNKPWTLSLTGDSATISELAAALNKGTPMQSVQALLNRAPLARTTLATNVIVTLDELDQIIKRSRVQCPSCSNDTPDPNGECTCANNQYEDVVLRMTNGATITGTQLVQRILADHGYVTLVHPAEGPINLYRTARHANHKQRTMLTATNTTCAWPECNHPAEECQFHHIQAWKYGGDTNLNNLVPLCPYHNGVNDNDPNAPPRRGRITKINGKAAWLPPWGGPPRYTND